jgi:cell wall-associated NlpC family hydrolase
MALFAFTACHPQLKTNELPAIESVLDSLKLVYAPDTRIALWEVELSGEGDSILIRGALDNAAVYTAITESIGTQFPNVDVQLKILPEENSGQLVTALINNSVANLRSHPRHSAELATQALLGMPIRILKKEGEWYLVQTPNRYIAWIDDDGIVEINKQELNTYKSRKKVVYKEIVGFSYAVPNVHSQTVSDLVLGCILPVIDSKRRFYQVQYPDKRLAWVKKKEVVDLDEILKRSIDEKYLLAMAKHFLGFPYLWGGTSAKAVDCSGFTSTIYAMNGIILQRDASQQTKYGKEITTDYQWKKLQAGDLLFFGRKASDSLPERVTHVAMYIGNTEFIHASGKVRINSMDSTKENFIPEYVPRFVRAIRIDGAIDGKGIERMADNDFYKEITATSK